MEIAADKIGNVAVVLIPLGELDASNAGELKRDITPVLQANTRLVIDLSRLRFIDSSGLGAMLSCLRQLTAKGGDLKLCGMSKQVRAAFELVRMHRIFDIFPTREEAVVAFQAETAWGSLRPITLDFIQRHFQLALMESLPHYRKRLGRPKVAVNPTKITLMRQEGASWASIAKTLGVGEGTVRRAAVHPGGNTLPKWQTLEQLIGEPGAGTCHCWWSRFPHLPSMEQEAAAEVAKQEAKEQAD